MEKTVIMVGFHFPPSALSSGHLRMLAFAKYLPEFGWKPVALSATRSAYERINYASVQSIPEHCSVYRAIALDAKRHFGLFGKYPSWLAQPDRWSSWWPAAVARGLQAIKRHKVQAIWSTYPIMTAHCVAHTLNRVTGIPWIADFRDPVASSTAGQSRTTVESQARWERRVVARASRCTFTAPGAMRAYAERFIEASRAGRLTIVGNGYDDADFIELPPAPSLSAGRPLLMVHSGVLYPRGRDPHPFLLALTRLKSAGRIDAGTLQIVLRASGNEPEYSRKIRELGLADIVRLLPPISNHEALLEQAGADALLLFQGEQFNKQIPAKLYEYLRIARPIFALVGENGDTATILREAGGATLVPIEDSRSIEALLMEFVQAVRDGRAPSARPEQVAQYSRREGTAILSRLLDEVTA